MDYSVLMSVYFKEKPQYLKQSLDSILNQTAKTDDIVLICDGPLSAELDDVIDEYSKTYSEINVIRLDKNGGLGNALNKGLNYCRHDLVARMDTDDIALPHRMETQLSVFLENPDISLISASLLEFQNDDIKDITCEKKLPITHEEIVKYAKKRNPFNHPTVMFKKAAVLSAGGYQHFSFFEDYYLWVRMILDGSVTMNIAEPLLLMRAGEEMYDRRGGLNYLKCVYRFRKRLWKLGFTSFIEFVTTTSGHSIVSLMPSKMRIAFYKKLLRK